MAFLIELSPQQQFELKNFKQYNERCIAEMRKLGVRDLLVDHKANRIFSLVFKTIILQKHPLISQFDIDKESQTLHYQSNLYCSYDFGNIKSLELLKTSIKIIKLINFKVSKSQFSYAIINPTTGHILIKYLSSFKQIYNFQDILIIIKNIYTSTNRFLNTFTQWILHTSNRISNNQLIINQEISHIYNYYLGKNGYFKLSSQLRQFLILQDYHTNTINASINQEDSTQLDQQELISHLHSVFKESITFTASQQLYEMRSIFQKQDVDTTDQFLKEALKPLNDQQSQKHKDGNKFLFSTITVKNNIKIRQIYKKQAINLQCHQIMYSYIPSENIGENQLVQTEDSKLTSGIIKKKIVAKIPNPQYININNQKHISAVNKIQWQKNILTNLRTSSSKYLPKYYHTIQNHHHFKDALLIDYIEGSSLNQKMYLTKQTMTIMPKIIVAFNISNALRFLDDSKISHLDLTPANIMVLSFQIKLIDFGQSYCKVTYQKLLPKSAKQYLPGRSPPYCPPETTTRRVDFTSKQDIYSFGINLFEIFFNTRPITCTQKQLYKLFKLGQYHNRILFVPQIAEYIGISQFYTCLAGLIFRMLHPNQNKRPSIIWAQQIFKILVNLIFLQI